MLDPLRFLNLSEPCYYCYYSGLLWCGNCYCLQHKASERFHEKSAVQYFFIFFIWHAPIVHIKKNLNLFCINRLFIHCKAALSPQFNFSRYKRILQLQQSPIVASYLLKRTVTLATNGARHVRMKITRGWGSVTSHAKALFMALCI